MSDDQRNRVAKAIYKSHLPHHEDSSDKAYWSHCLGLADAAIAAMNEAQTLKELLSISPVYSIGHSTDSPGHASYRTWTTQVCRACDERTVRSEDKLIHAADCPWKIAHDKYMEES